LNVELFEPVAAVVAPAPTNASNPAASSTSASVNERFFVT